jgi:hypothetical protein
MKDLHSSKSLGFTNMALVASPIGAVAVGAFAIGVLAIGRLAIRRVSVGTSNSNPLRFRT